MNKEEWEAKRDSSVKRMEGINVYGLTAEVKREQVHEVDLTWFYAPIETPYGEDKTISAMLPTSQFKDMDVEHVAVFVILKFASAIVREALAESPFRVNTTQNADGSFTHEYDFLDEGE